MRLIHFPSFFVALPVFATILGGCGGQEKFANSNVAVSSSGADKDLVDAQTEKVTEPPSKPGKYGGTITDAALADPKTFNLWVAGDSGSSGAVGGLYLGLIARNAYTLEWEAELAKELPTISKDGKTWTFILRDGLKWSDGAPLTADDIIFTLDVIYDEKVQTNFRESMTLDAPDGRGGFKRVPLKYRKIDAKTVEFQFPVPYAPARDILNFAVAPKHKLYEAWRQGQPKKTGFNPAYGVDTDPKQIVASGPWIMTQYVPGQRMVYKRNRNYWKKDEQGRALPYLDQSVTLITSDTNAMTLRFTGGETDVSTIQQKDFKVVKAQESAKNFTLRNLGPSFTTTYFSFNMNMRSKPAQANPDLFKLLNDKRFRQGISHAIDRQKLARNVFQNLATPLYGPVTPANKVFYNPDIPKWEFDIEKAKAKFAECGLKDSDGNGFLEFASGKEVTFNIITNVENESRKSMAAIITSDIKRAGINATFTPISFNSLLTRVDAKPEAGEPYPDFDWQAMILGFGGGIDPNEVKNLWRSEGNMHQWEPYQKKPARPWEAEIDKLYIEGAQELDEAKRKKIYDKWQEIVGEEQPLIYTVTPDSLVAMKNKFGNIKPTAYGGVTWNIEEIYDLSATRDKP